MALPGSSSSSSSSSGSSSSRSKSRGLRSSSGKLKNWHRGTGLMQGPAGQRCRRLNGASACRLTTSSGGSKQGPFAAQCCSSRLGQMMQRGVRSVAPTKAQSGA
ncbi:hypothetical protein OEZ86_005079 [Tetradesmus obliquus]|nr:hypothetical protein OEZ86_005079 [Tetradesmus obliquus]